MRFPSNDLKSQNPDHIFFQSLKRTHWDAILALEKPTNTLKLERDEIIEQVSQTKHPSN